MEVVHLFALTLIVFSGTLSAPRGKRSGDLNPHSLQELEHINIDNHIDMLHSDILEEVSDDPESNSEPEEQQSESREASNIQSNTLSRSAAHEHADRDLALDNDDLVGVNNVTPINYDHL